MKNLRVNKNGNIEISKKLDQLTLLKFVNKITDSRLSYLEQEKITEKLWKFMEKKGVV